MCDSNYSTDGLYIDNLDINNYIAPSQPILRVRETVCNENHFHGDYYNQFSSKINFILEDNGE